MPHRLTLLCAGGTAMARVGGFPATDAPLDAGEGARAAAPGLSRIVHDAAFVAPTASARATASAMGLAPIEVPPLADIDHGAWAGLTFAEVADRDGAGLAAWLAAPEAGAPGGESLAKVIARVSPWLEEIGMRQERVLAVTHPMVMRAVLATALKLPPAATMRIDIAPLGRAILSFNRGWRLQALIPRRSGP